MAPRCLRHRARWYVYREAGRGTSRHPIDLKTDEGIPYHHTHHGWKSEATQKAIQWTIGPADRLAAPNKSPALAREDGQAYMQASILARLEVTCE